MVARRGRHGILPVTFISLSSSYPCYAFGLVPSGVRPWRLSAGCFCCSLPLAASWDDHGAPTGQQVASPIAGSPSLAIRGVSGLARLRSAFDMSAALIQTGGARLDAFNATMPFATLSVTQDALKLSCMGRDYVFPKGSIQRLTRHRGVFSVGLRIEHIEKSLPQFVVFWTSAFFFWTWAFSVLTTRLESLGYEVRS